MMSGADGAGSSRDDDVMHNVIQISGGIDSMALLFYLRGLWDDSIVMWCDTGAAYTKSRN